MRTVEIALSPDDAIVEAQVARACRTELGMRPNEPLTTAIRKRSIDARGRRVLVRMRVDCFPEGESIPAYRRIIDSYRDAHRGRTVLIIGAGPAGYFAALRCIELGMKPIVVDRGKDVRSRRRDLRAIQQFSEVNPDSNYCFGEGGAGTYSDGKLWTNAKKRGDIQSILRLLYEHGAKEDVLIDAHPHIGSNKLPGVVSAIRDTIERHGGEVHFNAKVTDFIISDGTMRGAVVNHDHEFIADAVILATGHSARDIFALCAERKVAVEAKPFALGIRIEHPQAIIDEVQYKQRPRHELLPAAAYKLVTHVEDRGVFSFCMCPGGIIVPAATAPGELVVNGMSMSRRDSKYANSGIVVAIELSDVETYRREHGELAALAFQAEAERAMFAYGDGSQAAPAQRMIDFVQRNTSASLPDCSYIPGIYSAPIHEILPRGVSKRLAQGFKNFGSMMRGYFTNDAILVGIESRTSSPVRIPRRADTLEHTSVRRLFPCGEGAGYAGGIVSAALDGMNVASAIARELGVSSPTNS